MIYLGADHRGFKLKELLKKYLDKKKKTYSDCGAFVLDSKDDYTDYAKTVAKKIQKSPKSKGILICGSGEGIAMAANRYKKVRAAVCWDRKVAKLARQHNNANILVLSADFLTKEKAKGIIDTFLSTKFSTHPRHARRLRKMDS